MDKQATDILLLALVEKSKNSNSGWAIDPKYAMPKNVPKALKDELITKMHRVVMQNKEVSATVIWSFAKGWYNKESSNKIATRLGLNLLATQSIVEIMKWIEKKT